MRSDMKFICKIIGVLFVSGVCIFIADLNVRASIVEKEQTIQMDSEKNIVNSEITKEEKIEKILQILDPDGELGLKVSYDDTIEDGDYVMEGISYEVETEEQHKILMKRLKKYQEELDAIEEREAE